MRLGLPAIMRLFLHNSLSSYCARIRWGFAVGILLSMSCYGAQGALAERNLSQQDRQHAVADGSASLTVAGGRLTVNLMQADLREVLSRIGQEAGFSVKMTPTAQKTITAEFMDMALDEGLRRLLRAASQSYAMLYDMKDDTRVGLKELWVFSAGTEGAPNYPTTVARHDAAAVTEPERSQQGSSTAENPLLDLFHRQQRETVSLPPGNFVDLVVGRGQARQ